MFEPPLRPRSFGAAPRGITQSDVSHAADALLRLGERPTNAKVRGKIGKGSLTTINPMLDAWWKTLTARLDFGPAALHRLPESVAHVAEALWMQCQDEARRRAHIESKSAERQNADQQQNLEVRSHVLTLRDGELDSRLRDRDRTIDDLNLRLRELTGLLRKEQVTRELLVRQLADIHTASVSKQESKRSSSPTKKRKPKRVAPKRAPQKRRKKSR